MNSFIKNIKTVLGDVEMCPYSVIADHKTYEERLYPAKKWVCTTAKNVSRYDCISPMFRLLFNYISGRNKTNIRIDMTTPVTTFVIPGASPTCESTFTMGFFVPEEHQENPPEPVDESIFIEDRSELKVFTRRFGGYSTDEVVLKEAKELMEILQSAGEEGIDYNQYYVVGYDPPYKLINRRNEIWFYKKSSQEPAKAAE